MNHLSKIVVGLAAIQSVEAANITGVIDVTGFAYSAGSATITGNPSVNFDCEINDGWSGYIDPTLSIRVSSGLGSFSSPNVDVSVSPSFIPTIDGEWTSRCSLSSSGSYTLNSSGYIPYISETFTGKSGKLVCEPTLSYNNVTGTLSGQYTSCRFNPDGTPPPTPTPTTPTCDDSHLDQCITQEQCESIDKYWYSDQCNVTPEITFESVLTGDIAINGGERQQLATLNLSDSVEVSGNITVASAHVGQTADLFVYAETTIPGIPDTLYFMLKGEPGLEILAWDQNEANLVAFQSNVTLAAEQPVSIYSGNFIYPGTLKVYFGYRLADGTLVKSSEPIDITINDDSTPPPVSNTEPAAFAGTLAAHNAWRQQVGVPDLTWSEEAATVAQDWATHQQSLGCTMAHNPNRGNYGENVYWAMGSTPSPKDVVDAWGSEIADYDYATNSCQPGKVCGHYTQVIWRDTQKVGCGTASCDDGSIFWVCNYDPPGNYMGQTPY